MQLSDDDTLRDIVDTVVTLCNIQRLHFKSPGLILLHVGNTCCRYRLFPLSPPVGRKSLLCFTCEKTTVLCSYVQTGFYIVEWLKVLSSLCASHST
jgi:hypothetical protein